MKKTFLICIFLLSNIKMNSQVFTPPSFENYSPLWSRISITNKLPLNVQGYDLDPNSFASNKRPLVIHDNKMYSVYNIFKEDFDGYYLDVIDLSTGNLSWEDSYLGYERNTRKYGLNVSVKNNQVELMLFNENQPPGSLPWPIWLEAQANKNTYDLTTGILVDSTSHIAKDSNAKILGKPFYIFGPTGTDLYSEGNNYRYLIQSPPLYNTSTGQGLVSLQSFLLSPTGLVLDSTIVEMNSKYPIKYRNKLDLEDQTMIGYNMSELKSDSSRKYKLNYYIYNRELKILDSSEISTKLPEGDSYGMTYANSTYFTILTSTNDPQFYFHHDYITSFKRNGDVVETINLKPLNLFRAGSDFSNEIGNIVIVENGVPKILFCVVSLKSGNYFLRFYKSDGHGNYTEVKQLKYKAGKISYIGSLIMSVVGENILCNFRYYDLNTRLDPIPRWPLWIMFKGSDLGLITASKEISKKEDIKFILSPNPVLNTLKISCYQEVSGILQIYNGLGLLMKSHKLQDTKEIMIDVRGLSKGNYFIQIIGEKYFFEKQFIKVD